MPTLPKMKFHPAVKKHFGARALVSLLMLVIDYIVPPNEDSAFVFNAWVKVIQTQWATSHRHAARAWASEQHLIASDHIVDTPLRRPKCIDSLPYREEFTTGDIVSAVVVLQANNVPPDNGYYWMHVPRGNLDALVIQAVKDLPCFPRAALWTALKELEGQGSEFDDVRVELIGMAFDYASIERGANYNHTTLVQYAHRMLDERLAPSAPVLTSSTLTRTQKDIADECENLCSFLIAKNRKYGDSALDPVHIFSKEPAHVQLRQQVDHKLARIKRGDVSIEDEDVIKDLIGYLVLYRIALRRHAQSSNGIG